MKPRIGSKNHLSIYFAVPTIRRYDGIFIIFSRFAAFLSAILFIVFIFITTYDYSFSCYITLYSYIFDFGCKITTRVCQMVTEHQEKSICDLLFLGKQAYQPASKASDFRSRISQIPPLRLNSSNNLFSFFAIIIIHEHNYPSTSIASMKSENSASNSLIFLIVISFFLEASINSVLDRSVSSNLLL